MAVEHFNPDVDGDENLVQIAALTPTDNAVIIGNGAAWTAESGATLRTSLGLGIGTDVMAYDADLADWAGVNPSSYLTTAAAASTYLTQANAATTYQPLAAALTSWAAVTRASGFDTFAATPTSANLRALLSDESGSGALLFAGGALGTPASGVLTNCTGLPNASVVGLGTAALVNTGTSGATAALNNGANIWSARQAVAMTTPWSYLSDTSQAVDAKNWSTLVSAGTLYFQTHNDALSSGATWLSVPRSGNTPGVPNFTLTPTVAGDPVMTRDAAETVTGVKTFNGVIQANSLLTYVNSSTMAATSIGRNNSQLAFAGGTSGFRWINSSLSVDTMQLSDDGALVLGNPTGGFKSAGMLNAIAVYDDNVLLSCYVLDAALDGGVVDMDKWDAKVPNREHAAQYEKIEPEEADSGEPQFRLVAEAYVEERIHVPARKFTGRLGTQYDPLTLEGYERHWREKRHLTAFPNEAKFDPVKDAHSTGEWLQRLIEDAEIKAVLIAELTKRLAALEARQ